MAYIVTCACCGVALDNDETEIALDAEGDECFMCHRCFNEDCDCHVPEPMFALEPERPSEAEYAYFHESEDGEE